MSAPRHALDVPRHLRDRRVDWGALAAAVVIFSAWVGVIVLVAA